MGEKKRRGYQTVAFRTCIRNIYFMKDDSVVLWKETEIFMVRSDTSKIMDEILRKSGLTKEYPGIELKVYPADGIIGFSDYNRNNNGICIHGHAYLNL